MREISLRVLKSVVATVLLLAACGYGFAVAARAYVATDRDSGEGIEQALAWRLPFTLAAWGGGMVLVYELFRTLWGPKPSSAGTATGGATSPVLDAEQLLQQLLDQADAAEKLRQAQGSNPSGMSSNVTDRTPMPRGESLPVGKSEMSPSPPIR